MDNELREILTQLVDTTNKLVEGQKRTDEHFQKVDERLDKMSTDISNIKETQEQMSTDISNLKETQEQMSIEIKSIKLELENRVSRLLKSLCEMQLENSKRLRILESDVQEFKDQLAVGEVLYSLKESDYL